MRDTSTLTHNGSWTDRGSDWNGAVCSSTDSPGGERVQFPAAVTVARIGDMVRVPVDKALDVYPGVHGNHLRGYFAGVPVYVDLDVDLVEVAGWAEYCYVVGEVEGEVAVTWEDGAALVPASARRAYRCVEMRDLDRGRESVDDAGRASGSLVGYHTLPTTGLCCASVRVCLIS